MAFAFLCMNEFDLQVDTLGRTDVTPQVHEQAYLDLLNVTARSFDCIKEIENSMAFFDLHLSTIR